MSPPVDRTPEQVSLSVVVPTYNGEAHLEEALESIAAQSTLNGVEILVVDDGSTDKTMGILEKAAQRLPMTIHRREHQGNWVANTNFALRKATGSYTTILHQDDRWVPGRVSTLQELTRSWPNAVIFSHPVWIVSPRGRRLGLSTNPLPPSPPCHEGAYVAERLLVQNWMAMPAPVFNRRAALAAGGMDESLLYTADWDLWLKLIDAGRLFYSPKPLAEFRIHLGAQTMSISADPDRFRLELLTVIKRHLDTWAPRLPRADLVRKVAESAIELNCFLAGIVHGRRGFPLALIRRALPLGPRGWYRLWDHSRVLERAWPRLLVHSPFFRG